jgi:hypothetical protein
MRRAPIDMLFSDIEGSTKLLEHLSPASCSLRASRLRLTQSCSAA